MSQVVSANDTGVWRLRFRKGARKSCSNTVCILNNLIAVDMLNSLSGRHWNRRMVQSFPRAINRLRAIGLALLLICRGDPKDKRSYSIEGKGIVEDAIDHAGR